MAWWGVLMVVVWLSVTSLITYLMWGRHRSTKERVLGLLMPAGIFGAIAYWIYSFWYPVFDAMR